MSRLGIQFSTANGQAVPAQGRREIAVSIPVYGKAKIGFEVSEVDKLLLSSHQMARLGLFGWLGHNDGGLYDARGVRVIDLTVYNEVYWIPLWVKNSDVQIDDDQPAAQQQQTLDDQEDGVGNMEPKVIAEVSKVSSPQYDGDGVQKRIEEMEKMIDELRKSTAMAPTSSAFAFRRPEAAATVFQRHLKK